MTAENFDVTLRTLAEVRPFRVFTIELHGGRRIEVDYPTALSVRGGVAVYIAPENIPIIFDHDSVNLIIAEASSSLS